MNITETVSVEESTLGAAVIGTFKTPKNRHVGRSAGAGLVDQSPKVKDSNPWAELLSKRRGYEFSICVLARIIAMFRQYGSKPEDGYEEEPLANKALVLIFQRKSQNFFATAEKRRSNLAYTTHEETGIILLQGRRYLDDESNPSIFRQEQGRHVILPVQMASYCVPLLTPH